MIRDVAQYRRPGLVSNDGEHGGCFEVGADKGLGDQCKHEKGEQNNRNRELRPRRDGLATASDAMGEAMEGAGAVECGQGSSGRGGRRG